jgi:hypothetical protein
MALRLILCAAVCATPGLRGRKLFHVALPPHTQFGKSAISVLPPQAPEFQKQETFSGGDPAAYLRDQVTDVNWREFGHKALHGSLECVPQCLKYVLPNNEAQPIHHTVGKVGQCILWECVPNAFRNAGKPGPLVADSMGLLQMKLEQDQREREAREREFQQAAQMQAVLRHDRDLEEELRETQRDDQLAWLCAGAAGTVALALGFVTLRKPKEFESLSLVPV